eukprot:gene5125-3679_t
MVKIIDVIKEALDQQRNFVALEFTAPTTEAGTLTLYDRIERLSGLNPLFCSVTWGDFGCTADTSVEVASISQTLLSVNYQVNVTGYSSSRSEMFQWLTTLKEKGVQSILATRGHTVSAPGRHVDFPFAADLVRFVREKFADHFSVAVVGDPEAVSQSEDEMKFLQKKVESGADYIISQPVFSAEAFTAFRNRCKCSGITCPILPSIAPIQYLRQLDAFGLSEAPGAGDLRRQINSAANETAARRVCVEFFQELASSLLKLGACGIYFFMLNAESTVTSVVKSLSLPTHRALPWKLSENEERRLAETARPVHWSTREKSYMARTAQWKDFKSGGILGPGSTGSQEDGAGLHARLLLKTRAKRCAQFLAVRGVSDIPRALIVLSGIFVQYLDGHGAMPWAEGLSEETALVLGMLKPLNARGLFTICSQPQVNGADSSNQVFGWGPPHGYIYQKGYLEFFCSPATAQTVFTTLGKFPSLRFMAMTRQGSRMVKSNWKDSDSTTAAMHQAFGRGVTAVTWGVFPGREIIQPTIVSIDTFRAWVEEAFDLWAAPFALNEVPPVIRLIQEEWVLVCLVDNAYTLTPSPMELAASEICCKIPPLKAIRTLLDRGGGDFRCDTLALEVKQGKVMITGGTFALLLLKICVPETMNELQEILRRTLSSDNAERKSADAQLVDASQHPGFVDTLLGLLSSPDCSLAVVSYLRRQCESASWNDQLKIAESLLSLLVETDATLPKAVARVGGSAISHAAKRLEQQCTAVSDPGEREVLVSHFNALCMSLFQKLTTIFGPTENSDPCVRQRLLLLLLELLQDLDDQSFLRQELMSDVVALLLESLVVPSVQQRVCSRNDGDVFLLTVDVLSVAFATGDDAKAQGAFTRLFGPLKEAAFSPAISVLPHLHDSVERDRLLKLETFVSEVVTTNQWAMDLIDPDTIRGILVSLFEDRRLFLDQLENPTATEDYVRRHAACRWSVLGALARGKKNLFSQAFFNEADVEQYYTMMVHYGLLSASDVADLIADANAFLAEEDDRAMGQIPATLRDSVALACTCSCKALGEVFARVALPTFLNVLVGDRASQESAERESALFLLQCMIAALPKKVAKKIEANQLVSAALQIISNDAIHGTPVQVARSLMLLPRLLEFLSVAEMSTDTLRMELVSLAIGALHQLSTSEHKLIKVSSCKFLFHVMPVCSPEELAGVVANATNPISDMLLEDELTDESLYVVLETLGALLQKLRLLRTRGVASDVTPPPQLCSAVFTCWRCHIADPNVGDLVRDIFKEAVQFPVNSDAMLPEFEWMKTILSRPSEELCVGPTIMKMMTDVFRRGTAEIAQQAVEALLGPLVHLILSVEFTSILSISLTCLAALLARCPTGNAICVTASVALVSQSLGTPANTGCDNTAMAAFPLTTVLTAVTLRILHPALSEVALFDAKRGLQMVVRRMQDFPPEEASQIAMALTSRALSVKTETVSLQLLSPLSALCYQHQEMLLDILHCQNKVPEVFSWWLHHIAAVSSFDDLLCNCRALLGLLKEPNAIGGYVLENWAPSSAQPLDVGWSPKSSRRRGASGVLRVGQVSLGAAIFVTVGKTVIRLADLWTGDDLSTSSRSSSSGLFSETSDEEEVEMEAEAEAEGFLDNPEHAARRVALADEMKGLLAPLPSLWMQYGDAAGPLFKREEVDAIQNFLQLLEKDQA